MLFSISEQTGGEAVKVDAAGQAFSRMIERIRTRYSIHYNMPDSTRAGLRVSSPAAATTAGSTKAPLAR